MKNRRSVGFRYVENRSVLASFLVSRWALQMSNLEQNVALQCEFSPSFEHFSFLFVLRLRLHCDQFEAAEKQSSIAADYLNSLPVLRGGGGADGQNK
jgi:hypothetical protein